MASRFHVVAEWDEEAGVFISRSNIPGLVVETATFEEFVDIVTHLAPEMLAENIPDALGPFTIEVSALKNVLLKVA